jgi:hypothetical protein
VDIGTKFVPAIQFWNLNDAICGYTTVHRHQQMWATVISLMYNLEINSPAVLERCRNKNWMLITSAGFCFSIQSLPRRGQQSLGDYRKSGLNSTISFTGLVSIADVFN